MIVSSCISRGLSMVHGSKRSSNLCIVRAMGFELNSLDFLIALLLAIVLPYCVFLAILTVIYNRKFKGKKKVRAIFIAIALAPMLYPLIDSIKPVSEILSF